MMKKNETYVPGRNRFSTSFRILKIIKIFILFLIFVIENVSADIMNTQQSLTISGKVTDSSNIPIPSVTVVIKGTTQGTITDDKGNYLISNVPKDGMLVFSFVGMETQEVAVNNQTNINVRMAEDSETVGCNWIGFTN